MWLRVFPVDRGFTVVFGSSFLQGRIGPMGNEPIILVSYSAHVNARAGIACLVEYELRIPCKSLKEGY